MGAMQAYDLQREYAINALTIKNELISLRVNRGLDILQALKLLNHRVKSMQNIPAKPPLFQPTSRHYGDLTEDLHTEKRRRLTKSRCLALNRTANGSFGTTNQPSVTAAAPMAPPQFRRGNEENLVRADKRAVEPGSLTTELEVESDMVDFKRARRTHL